MRKIQSGRRRFIQNAAFGIIGITASGSLYSAGTDKKQSDDSDEPLFYRYPAINDSMASAIVGAAHSDLNKVKDLVSKRPELALATWDWGFGDWETAIGAASHVGRRDIAELLISYGARPDIFTMAMMGSYKAVQDMVESVPGIQSIPGPHGITLLQHAKNRLRIKDISTEDQNNAGKVISYLEGLGNADVKPKSMELAEEEKQNFFGEYRFGKGADEIFVVDQNSRKLLQLGRKGYSGRVLNKIEENIFFPSGAPSVKISFKLADNKTISLTIHEPEPLVTAVRI
jgi:hypothetical protein